MTPITPGIIANAEANANGDPNKERITENHKWLQNKFVRSVRCFVSLKNVNICCDPCYLQCFLI